jgi:hypothetical protein
MAAGFGRWGKTVKVWGRGCWSGWLGRRGTQGEGEARGGDGLPGGWLVPVGCSAVDEEDGGELAS